MFCPICTNPVDNSRVIAECEDAHYSGGEVKYYYCMVCGGVFHKEPMPEDYYRMTYRREVDNEIGQAVRLQEARAKSLKPWLEMLDTQFDGIAHALDFGASAGVLCKLLGKYAHVVDGVDQDEIYSKYAEAHYGMRYIPLEEVPENFYDLITCIHTLEHLSSPVKDLRRLYNVATEHAALLVEVPDFITSPLALSYAHKFAFSRESLFNALRLSGWYPVWIIPFWGIHRNMNHPINLLSLSIKGQVVTRMEYEQQSARLGESLARKEKL